MSPRVTVVPSERRAAPEDRARALANPGFGRYFTDHMVSGIWSEDDGWSSLEVGELKPLPMHPASAVLHYGQEVFEGLKAYRHTDDSIWLFRPDKNAARLNQSARRLALPELDPELFVESARQLVEADQDWVPAHGSEASLYLRPFLIGTEPFLGVRPSREAYFGVIACPAGPYFAGGMVGVNLWISTDYARAAPGGTGSAKCGGNYAASLLPQLIAKEHGCDQVLYTCGDGDARYVDESGTMNLFAVTSDGELITPSLGTILDGVTRDSVLAIAPEHGLRPVERTLPLRELLDGCADGSVTEVFAAGTAAVITPITGLRGDDVDLTIGEGKPGQVTVDLRHHVLDIQHGNRPDEHGWLVRVC